MITTIFLDNDGILVDTERYYFEANQETCERYGHVLTRTDYQRLFLTEGSGLREVATQLGWSDEKLAEVRAERDYLYETLLRTRDIVLPGVEEGLTRLGEHFDLCIVTGSPQPFFDIIHERTGFARFFDNVVSAEDVTHHKPDPEPYRCAVEKMGALPENGVAIEDSARGLHSATGAGLRCVVVPRELTKDQDFSGAAAVVETFLDAVSLVEWVVCRGLSAPEPACRIKTE